MGGSQGVPGPDPEQAVPRRRRNSAVLKVADDQPLNEAHVRKLAWKPSFQQPGRLYFRVRRGPILMRTNEARVCTTPAARLPAKRDRPERPLRPRPRLVPRTATTVDAQSRPKCRPTFRRPDSGARPSLRLDFSALIRLRSCRCRLAMGRVDWCCASEPLP